MEDKSIKARDKAFSLEPTNIWKVRQKKAYGEAHNHIYLGEVIKQTQLYIIMRCITFHFGKQIDSMTKNDIITGMHRIRRIPWTQIEVIHDIAKDFDYAKAELVTDEEGTAVLRDKNYDCIITKRTDRLK